jgi:hypothetical protein
VRRTAAQLDDQALRAPHAIGADRLAVSGQCDVSPRLGQAARADERAEPVLELALDPIISERGGLDQLAQRPHASRAGVPLDER